jgi:hypothetical protein
VQCAVGKCRPPLRCICEVDDEARQRATITRGEREPPAVVLTAPAVFACGRARPSVPGAARGDNWRGESADRRLVSIPSRARCAPTSRCPRSRQSLCSRYWLVCVSCLRLTAFFGAGRSMTTHLPPTRWPRSNRGCWLVSSPSSGWPSQSCCWSLHGSSSGDQDGCSDDPLVALANSSSRARGGIAPV